MSNISDLLFATNSHEEWLELMRFGVSYVAKTDPIWLVDEIKLEAWREIKRGSTSNTNLVQQHIWQNLGIRLTTDATTPQTTSGNLAPERYFEEQLPIKGSPEDVIKRLGGGGSRS